MFAILGWRRPSESSALNFIPLYEQGLISHLDIEFRKLIDSDPEEELLQKFIERNPITLHQFPAQKIFYKPQILTFFKADFAIVTPQKELILIEIETVHTRLLRKDGGEAAPLQHAFDQVRNWLHVTNEHRLAVLDCLQLKREEVSLIRGAVIAGSDKGYDVEHLRRLKGVDRGQILFMTFDDLWTALHGLGLRMRAA